MELSEIQKAKAQKLRNFKHVTQQQSRIIESRLLAADDTVYEIDFGEPIGLLHFQIMNTGEYDELLEYGHSLRETEPGNYRKLNRELNLKACGILARYCQDGLSKAAWIKLWKQDENRFNKILLNYVALCHNPADMMEFFRLLKQGQQSRSSNAIPTHDSKPSSATTPASV